MPQQVVSLYSSMGQPQSPASPSTIPDPQLWAEYGIQTLGDIITADRLLSLTELRARFHLPEWMTFRYFQLHHAIRAQFPTITKLDMDPIEGRPALEWLSKPLSTLYIDLLSCNSPRMERLWEKWKADMPDLDREDWDDCLGESAQTLISSRDRLI